MDHDADEEHSDAVLEARVRDLLSDPGTSDLELHDPPEFLWPRIAAALADDAPVTGSASPVAVEYRIDADDLVVVVADDWGSFEGLPDATEPGVVGSMRTLWSYFDGEEIVELWRLVVERVRATGSSATVPLRCDSSSLRRWFEMTVTAEPGGSVLFRSELQFEEPRADVPLLDPAVERDDSAAAVALCSWCAKGYDGNEWLDIEELLQRLRLLEDALPAVSYGICPTCRDAMSADLLVTERSQR